MSQRQGSRHPHLGWGCSPCSVLGQQEKSSSQPQVLGLTRQPHSSSFPPKSCLCSLPQQEALGCSSVLEQPSPAQPSSSRGCCGPSLTTKALQADRPHCPGAGLPDEALPTPHLPGSPGSCCCLPQPTWLHG